MELERSNKTKANDRRPKLRHRCAAVHIEISHASLHIAANIKRYNWMERSEVYLPIDLPSTMQPKPPPPLRCADGFSFVPSLPAPTRNRYVPWWCSRRIACWRPACSACGWRRRDFRRSSGGWTPSHGGDHRCRRFRAWPTSSSVVLCLSISLFSSFVFPFPFFNQIKEGRKKGRPGGRLVGREDRREGDHQEKNVDGCCTGTCTGTEVVY